MGLGPPFKGLLGMVSKDRIGGKRRWTLQKFPVNIRWLSAKFQTHLFRFPLMLIPPYDPQFSIGSNHSRPKHWERRMDKEVQFH